MTAIRTLLYSFFPDWMARRDLSRATQERAAYLLLKERKALGDSSMEMA